MTGSGSTRAGSGDPVRARLRAVVDVADPPLVDVRLGEGRGRRESGADPQQREDPTAKQLTIRPMVEADSPSCVP